MRCSRTAIVTISGCVLLFLAGCGKGGEQGGAPPGDSANRGGTQKGMSSDTSRLRPCEQYEGMKATTPGVGQISVANGVPEVDPDTMVQSKGNRGAFRWKLADGQVADSFRVRFKGGSSPLDDTVYTRAGPGTTGGTIRADADCGFYSYGVVVWQGGSPDSLTLDPQTEVIP